MKSFRLNPKKSAVLIVDVQETLFPLVEHPCDVLEKIRLLIQGSQLVEVPVFASEQYPKGLKPTIQAILDLIPKENVLPSKTKFSAIDVLPNYDEWIVAGIEAHVCVQQTVADLLQANKKVVVVNDAISSRSIYDFSTAIAEMRDMGARISSTEAVLFELVHDAAHPNFKSFSNLIK